MSGNEPERIRIEYMGPRPGEEGFPGEYFATIGTRDLTDQQYEIELSDEERELIKSRDDLYKDHGEARKRSDEGKGLAIAQADAESAAEVIAAAQPAPDFVSVAPDEDESERPTGRRKS